MEQQAPHLLTMLGIIIGVMAVIVIVGLGNGMTQSMQDSFSALGTNALSVQVRGYGSRTVTGGADVRYRGQPPGGVHRHVAHHHAGQHREGGYHHLWLYER